MDVVDNGSLLGGDTAVGGPRTRVDPPVSSSESESDREVCAEGGAGNQVSNKASWSWSRARRLEGRLGMGAAALAFASCVASSRISSSA